MKPGLRASRCAALALTVALVATSGCGGGTPSPDSTAGPGDTTGPSTSAAASSAASSQSTATPTPTIAPPTPTPTPPRSVAGEIILLIKQDGFVDDQPATTGDAVYAGGSIATGPGGSLNFKLDVKIRNCRLAEGSRVAIMPTADQVLRFVAGTAICATDSTTAVVRLGAETDLELVMADPQFLVTVEAERTIVRVLEGVLEVRSTASGASVLLGPKAKTEVTPGGDPPDPASWGTGELEGTVLDAVNELRNLPDPDKSMPDPAGSIGLQRIRDVGSVRLILDPVIGEADPDEEVTFERPGRFTQGFFGNQAIHWDLAAPEIFVGEIDEGRELLAGGQVDVIVAAQPIDGLTALPFFDDQAEVRAWLNLDAGDPGLVDAMREYLRLSVFDESYRIQYLSTFGIEPRYEFLAPIVGLE